MGALSILILSHSGFCYFSWVRQKTSQPSAAFSAVASREAQPAQGSLRGSKAREVVAIVGSASSIRWAFLLSRATRPPNSSINLRSTDAWSQLVGPKRNAEAGNRKFLQLGVIRRSARLQSRPGKRRVRESPGPRPTGRSFLEGHSIWEPS